MLNNKNWVIAGSIILGALILLGGTIWAISAFSFKAGIVNVDEVFNKSSLGKQINEELQTKANEYRTKITSAKTDSEKSKLNNEFEQLRNAKQQDFIDKMKQAIEKVAKRKGIKVLSNQQIFIYSENDLTEAVIKELDNK